MGFSLAGEGTRGNSEIGLNKELTALTEIGASFL